MRIEILGSGGAITTPRPFCDCAICERARREGPPETRTGPSVFVHGPDLLIDTPEESKAQLNRAGIRRVGAAAYSHWHPDHTAGRRVFESAFDFRGWPPDAKTTWSTDVYLPQRVAEDFGGQLGLSEHMAYLEQLGVVRTLVVPEGDSIELDDLRVTPIKLAEEYVYAFLLEDGQARALVVMDETIGWRPSDLGRLDVAILPLGIFEHDPFTGERVLHEEHPLLRLEALYPETLEIAGRLDAGRIVLSHIEHLDGISHARLAELGERDGWEPAFDGLVLDLGG